ncbi:hypothetical protein [Achromobacter xylosoxidans]|uniref:hypothetical protein n=1 Tax=Alcaligenes xylosoxydans xylosoxydans TaxID=85698 RepID=UPI001F12C62D|nr:hypothetical protein [Achromobacter xylosoxidans]
MEFIVICQSAWCNESGIGVSYDWDGERFPSRQSAILHGFETRGSDDFNIGVIDGDELKDFCWMEDPMCEDAETMADIARACGLDYAANSSGQGAGR